MSENHGKDTFREDKATRTYKTLTFLLVLLVLCAAALHFRIDALQKDLTQTVASAQAQSMLTQRIALLISQHQAGDNNVLQDLRNTVSEALTNQETLEVEFRAALPAILSDETVTQTSLETLGRFVSKSLTFVSKAMTYAADVQAEAKASGPAIISRARDAAALWNTLTTEYIDIVQGRIDTLRYVSMALYFLMPCLLAFMYLKIFRPAMANLTEQRKQLNRFAAIDQLTGVYNRAMLFKVARQLIGTYKRQEQPLTALAIDIDKLQKTNDTYGRAAGDALIKKVAMTINAALRSSDVLGRIGGDEFGVFLPSIDVTRAMVVAEKIRIAVEEMPFEIKDSTVLATVSIGVIEMKSYHNSPDDLLISAGIATRHAKEEGCNRVMLFSD